MIGMPGLQICYDSYLLMTVQDADLVSNVCPGKKGEKALVMENMEANAGSAGSIMTLVERFQVKPEVRCEVQSCIQ